MPAIRTGLSSVIAAASPLQPLGEGAEGQGRQEGEEHQDQGDAEGQRGERRAVRAECAVLLLMVGLTVSQLAARARRLQLITITDASYLAQIHDIAELTQTRSPYVVTDGVKERLTTLLTLEQCRFEYGTLLGHPPCLRPDGTVMAGHHRVDVEQFGLPEEEIELRTFSNGQFIGRFMLQPKPGPKPSLQARLVAVTLADQAGRAFGASQATPGRD